MLGILCGLESEAVIARRVPGALVACSAARPEKARGLARDLVARGATRLLSFGIAGGLDQGLPLGTLILGEKVVTDSAVWVCDAAWQAQLQQKLPHARAGLVWGSEILVAKATDKQALHHRYGCAIVDMESQCAAEVAAEFQLPLMVMRTICDRADMDVPDIVMATIAEDGSIDYRKTLLHVVRYPAQIPDLIHVGLGSGKALSVLKKSTHALVG